MPGIRCFLRLTLEMSNPMSMRYRKVTSFPHFHVHALFVVFVGKKYLLLIMDLPWRVLSLAMPCLHHFLRVTHRVVTHV